VSDVRIPPVPEVGRAPLPRRWIRVALALALPVAFVFFAVSVSSVGRAPGGGIGVADYSAPAVPVDRLAPSFTLPRLAGTGAISLDDLSGHPVVLSFWASWCSPCREEAPFLRMAWTTYRSEGVRFLGVDHRDARSAGLTSARRLAIPYPSVFDSSGELAGRYGLFGLPTTFVIRPDGRIAYLITGRVDGTNLESALNGLIGSD
jgi:cytochrome c biogenesis protein CcmG, thiol:disulfide interchange protein DsbE